jgi:hypothetical protein
MKAIVGLVVKCRVFFNTFYVDLPKEWHNEKKRLTNYSYIDN